MIGQRARFIVKGVLLTALITAPAIWFFQHHSIGIDPQQETCFPYRVYLTDDDPGHINVGDYIVFIMDRRGIPFFAPGQRFVKQIVAGPGDHVVVSHGVVMINGREVKKVSRHNAKRMGKKVSDFDRDIILKDGEYWVMATHPNSFDSVYWGILYRKQIIGKAKPLL